MESNELNLELLQKGANIFHSVKCNLVNYLNENFKRNDTENLKLINIAKFIEDKIKIETNYNPDNPLRAGIAFPVGLNVNQIVAHWSPNPMDTKQILKKTDLIKIDYGVQFDGNIIDSAFSYSYDEKYNELIKISEEATNKACELFGEEVLINDISSQIQEIIESKEIEINNKLYNVKSIQNITGHKISKFEIHSDKMIPNISLPNYTERIKNNELYAIETYPSTGNGYASLDYKTDNISHYMLNKDYKNIKNLYLNQDEKNLLKIIELNFLTLPFARRWLSNMRIKKYLITLFSLVKKRVINEYPTYYEKQGSFVAQTEKNIIIFDGKKEILT